MRFGTLTNPLAGLLGLGQNIGLQGLSPTTDLLGTLLGTTGLQSLFPTTTFPTTTFPTTTLPTTTFPTTTLGGLQCFTGRVNLIVTIRPSTIVATLTTTSGQTIFLITNSPTIRAQLAQVDNRFATVCGTLTVVDGRLALNVQVVIPQAVTPPINLQTLLLLLLLFLLLQGRISLTTLGTTGLGPLVSQLGGVTGLQQALTQFGGAAGVTSLVNQLGGEAAITSQLQQAGVAI